MPTRTASDSWQLTQRIRVSGGEVAADVFGAGQPVLLVHGTPAWSYLWRNVAPALARHHTVHVWDLLGYGDSRLDPGVAPTVERQARTLAELVAHWDLDSPSLVGHDIGGATVLRAHLVHDVPVRRLALVDAAVLGSWTTPFTAHMRRYQEAYRTMPPHVFGELVAARFRTATYRQPGTEALAAYLHPWSGTDGQQRWIDQVDAVDSADTRAVVDRLTRITAPTAVLWGEHDTWLEPATGARLAAAIPGARLTTIPDAGHFAPEDNPRDIAAALLTFLAEAEAGTGT